MFIATAYPPNWSEIDAAFGLTAKGLHLGALICYGDVIYNPGGKPVAPELLAHERIHKLRQLNFRDGASIDLKVKAWWRQYLADVEFRLDEEKPAHVAEWRKALELHRRDRVYLDAYLDHICKRLSGPMYGEIVSYEKARELIGPTWRA